MYLLLFVVYTDELVERNVDRQFRMRTEQFDYLLTPVVAYYCPI